MGRSTRLVVEPYVAQASCWPPSGRHVLAQFNDASIVVYQAYRSAIGRFAASHGYFGGALNFNRMSWIKPNFLWMMYRSAWGIKAGQEVILAIWLKRSAFDALLAEAVPTTFVAALYGTEADWKQAVHQASVLVQWDPDHDPFGAKVARRAIQLGLRGDALVKYAGAWIVHVEDISEFVHEQHGHVQSHTLDRLLTPRESLYPVTDPDVAQRLQLSPI
jgi:hypothetical protein